MPYLFPVITSLMVLTSPSGAEFLDNWLCDAKGYPERVEIYRFPPKCWVDSQLEFVDAMIDGMHARRGEEPPWRQEEIDDYLAKLKSRREIYRRLRWAWIPDPAIRHSDLRKDLQELREVLSPADWFRGTVPPILP